MVVGGRSKGNTMTLKKIVVATDFSEQAEVATSHALALAKKMGAELHVVHALGISAVSASMPYPVAVPEVYSAQVSEIHQSEKAKLDALCESFASEGITVIPVFVEENATDGIVNAAEKISADLVVVGSHGRSGLSRFLLGSVAEAVAKRAGCDVLVARNEAPEGGYQRLLVPTDFSEVSDKATAAAAVLVNPEGHVDVFHSWQMPGGPATYWGEVGDGLRENIRRGALEFGLKAISAYASEPGKFSFSEEEGDARALLQKRVEGGDYDLIVMGTHGRRGLGRVLMGSVTETTIRHTDRSVYLVR